MLLPYRQEENACIFPQTIYLSTIYMYDLDRSGRQRQVCSSRSVAGRMWSDTVVSVPAEWWERKETRRRGDCQPCRHNAAAGQLFQLATNAGTMDMGCKLDGS